MKKIILIFLLLFIVIEAKYLDSESCKECHENIYNQHTKSMHHKASLFSDEVHKKVQELSDDKKYSCALCHMPAAKNLSAIIRGTENPKAEEISNSDGVSCSFCHQISKIHYGKSYNINFSSTTLDEKPTMFANLDKPDSSNKHNSQSNEIYKNSEVCMGCHSHKENSNGFEVCNSKDQHDSRSDCIGCHMPKATGGNENFNKKGRSEYTTHNFLGIRSDEMVKKSVKLGLSYKNENIELSIENKMGHAIITHPMRLKFVKTVVLRDGKTIWSNFSQSPKEDKEATFIIVFKDSEEKQAMPHNAVGYELNQNLKAMSSKIVLYSVPSLQKGDIIKSTWVSYVVNPNIAKKLELTSDEITKQYIGDEVSIVIK